MAVNKQEKSFDQMNDHQRRAYSPLSRLRNLTDESVLIDLYKVISWHVFHFKVMSPTVASNMSISGADLPTKVPSECFGPG